MRGVNWALFRDAGAHWMDHNAPRLGAALAYYTVLSLAPLLVLVVAVTGFFFGDQMVRGQVYSELRETVGTQSAAVIQSLLTGTNKPAGVNLIAGLVLLVGASGVFVELRDALNYIWDAPPNKGSGFWIFIRDRVFSFAIVMTVGVLLAASVAVTALAHRFAATRLLPGNFVMAFLVKVFLFALIFRFIPEVHVKWKDVAVGAALTAILFEAGSFLTSVYLSEAGIGTAYGAAGSLVALLVWIYYSAQVFLYGAELTHLYAAKR